MFTSKFLKPRLMALAVCAAFAQSASADDVLLKSDASLYPSQTYFPSAGTVDTERANSAAALTQIRADYAYARNITGKGVTIAVLDTGISTGHIEFSEAGKLAQGFNTFTYGSDVADYAGHGTHVAGIIGAGRGGKGIFGVAYDAKLLPIKVLSNDGSGNTSYLDKGMRYAIGKAAIVNVSLGATTRFDPSAMREAVQAGLLIIAAAGNDGAADPNWPARFAKEAWANNQIIAVGAVDASNRIADFSNRAGDTAAWFLVAPGVRIASSYLNDQYVYMSGTSMATPIVSGAAALIKELWPALRADQIANILFLTATDLGAPGIDPVYGRGLLNVEKALQPIGAVTTTTFNGRTINILGGSVVPSSATSKLWNLAAAGHLRVVGLDDFTRDFNVDLGAAVAKPASLSLEQVLGGMDRRIEVAENVLADGSRLAVAYERTLTGAAAAPHAAYQADSYGTRLAAFSVVSNSAGGTETAMGIGGMASNYFGAGALELPQAAAFGMVPALSHPYFALVPNASHAAFAQDIDGVKIKFGLLTSGLNQTLASQHGVYSPAAPSWARQKANSAVFEVSESFGDAAMALSFSQTRESNAYLGSQSSGALLLSPRAATNSIQFAGAIMLASKLALAGQVSYGFTPGSNTYDSLIAEVSETRTNAFSLALVASDSVARGDRLSVAVSQPMRTYSGHITLDALAGVSGNGMPVRNRVMFSMEPVARELRTELNYQTPLGEGESMGLTLLLRHHPNHLEEAPMEKLLAMRYSKQF